MRIIAGVAKGRNLVQVANATRPTSDRAREALFSSIQSEFGDFSNLTFLDLYAGSGAIGLEALSRGFSQVVAVEKDEFATKTIKENLDLVARGFPPINSPRAHAAPVHSTRFDYGLPEATKLEEILVRLKWKMACPVMIFF